MFIMKNVLLHREGLTRQTKERKNRHWAHIFFISWQYVDTFENSLDQAEKYQLITFLLEKKMITKKVEKQK